MCALLSRLRHAKRGFTLIEMLLYIGIASIILVIALQVMIRVLESRQRFTAATDVQQNLRLALNRLIDTSLTASDVNIGSSTFGTTPGTLSFAMSSAGYNPTVFSVVGGSLVMTVGANPPVALTSPDVTVDLLRFTNLTPTSGVPAIRIEMHATQSGSILAGASQAMSIDTSFSLRR